MLRVLLALVIVVAAGDARAEERVALLPLDAEARLAIYGQPVASEVARSLRDASIVVDVIGAKMAVPESAQLIVDGTLGGGGGKSKEVVVLLRIRNPRDGVVLATVSATAASIATIDKAASDVAARLLPVLRERLLALRPAPTPTPTEPITVHHVQQVPPPELRPALIAVSMTESTSEPLRQALLADLSQQLRAVYREPQLVEAVRLSRSAATQTVQNEKLDLGLALQVTSYTLVMDGAVPIARASVRLTVADAVGLLFDRVIVTDSIVGERNMTLPALAARVAREVLDIARPHLRRKVRAWR